MPAGGFSPGWRYADRWEAYTVRQALQGLWTMVGRPHRSPTIVPTRMSSTIATTPTTVHPGKSRGLTEYDPRAGRGP